MVLPSNITDFNNLIMNKLREFLGHIEVHVRRARSESWSEDEFYRRVWSFLRAVNTFGKNVGDLLTYWDRKKSVFWSYVSMDPALVKKKIMSLVVDKLGIYERVCEEHKVEFTPEETDHSDAFFLKIRDARNSQAIKNTANDADLMILADCIVYSIERLQQGIVYLVTNDNELHDTTLAIVHQPDLIFPDIISGRLSGLEPLKPIRLVEDFRNRQA